MIAIVSAFASSLLARAGTHEDYAAYRSESNDPESAVLVKRKRLGWMSGPDTLRVPLSAAVFDEFVTHARSNAYENHLLIQSWSEDGESYTLLRRKRAIWSAGPKLVKIAIPKESFELLKPDSQVFLLANGSGSPVIL